MGTVSAILPPILRKEQKINAPAMYILSKGTSTIRQYPRLKIPHRRTHQLIMMGKLRPTQQQPSIISPDEKIQIYLLMCKAVIDGSIRKLSHILSMEGKTHQKNMNGLFANQPCRLSLIAW